MPERTYSATTKGYRFGFNGKEQDNEVSGSGNSYDYGFRIYNPRLGKFLSLDPLFKSYPWYTPYQFAGNIPIASMDLDGLEEYIFHMETYKNSKGETKLYAAHWVYINPNERQVDRRGTFMVSGMNTILALKNRPVSPRTNSQANVKSLTNSNSMENLAYGGSNANAIDHGVNPTRNYSGRKSGISYLPMKSTIKFATSDGQVFSEVQQSFDAMPDKQKEALDNLVGALVHDGEANVNVKGFASPKPVDFNGDGNITKEENLDLALSRATKTKEFIISYAKEKYGVDIDESRINTSGEVRDSTPDDGNNDNAEDRVSEIELNVNK